MIITNKSGGQLVCDLANGDTLRLNNNESITVSEENITSHLRHLEVKGLVTIRTKPKAKKVTNNE